MQASEVLQVRPLLPARRRERRQRQAAADQWIERGYDDPIDSPVAWRVQELISARERVRLARSVRGVLKDLSPTRLPGASPLRRGAVRPYAPLLVALAERLADLEQPVRAPGVLIVRRLLTDPDSVLYADASDVGGTLRAALRELNR